MNRPETGRPDERDVEAGDAQHGQEEHAEGQYEPAEAADRELDALARECEELRHLAQRAQADYQNLRRRAQADLEAGLRRALEPLLQNLLLVVDHLDMALAAPAEGIQAKSLAAGVEMTRRQLLSALDSEGVEAIPSAGSFDPERHQAVARVETVDAAPGTLLETVRKGYEWRGRVLRHAQVVVAAEPAAETP